MTALDVVGPQGLLAGLAPDTLYLVAQAAACGAQETNQAIAAAQNAFNTLYIVNADVYA